jgi:hypothetical protein
MRAPRGGHAHAHDDEDDASDNDQEWEERQQAAKQLLRQSGAAPAPAAALAGALEAARAADPHVVALVAWAVETRPAPTGRAPAGTPLPCIGLAHGDAHTRDPTVQRMVKLLQVVHAALRTGRAPAGSQLQRALVSAAARPPWPPVLGAPAAALTSLSALSAVAVVEAGLAVRVAGWCVLDDAGAGAAAPGHMAPHVVVMLAEWLQDGCPASLALRWHVTPAAVEVLRMLAPPRAPDALPGRQWITRNGAPDKGPLRDVAGWTYVDAALVVPSLVTHAAFAPPRTG